MVTLHHLQMGDTEMKKYARSTMYPAVERGLEGKGYGPANLTDMRAKFYVRWP